MDNQPQACKTRVAVVGGGIAGLAAAWALLERGYDVALYDERIHLGGKLGAHPARMALLPQTRAWSPSERRDARQYIEPATSSLKSDEAHHKLIAQLNAQKVPAFILAAVRCHYGRVWKRLGLPVSQDRLEKSVQRFFEQAQKSRRVKPLHDLPSKPLAAWEIAYDAQAENRRIQIAFRVAIHERDLGPPVLELTDAQSHEHCYHMYLNWYHNFWAMMDAVGLERSTNFKPLDEFVHVFPGVTPLKRRCRTLRTIGDFSHGADNVMSGAAPVPDLFLWFYSMLDLVGQRFDPGRYLDRRSVHAFLSSRWYATDESVRFHEHLLAKAFAVPTYFSSAHTYRKYVEYTMAAPEPMLWVLKGDSHDRLFAPLEKHLVEEKKLRVNRGLQVSKIAHEDHRLRMWLRPSDIRGPERGTRRARRPSDDIENPAGAADSPELLATFDPDYIVLAVPPSALTRITGELRAAVPELASVRKLQSAVTACLDLHFVRKLEGMPASHMVLRESALGLTVIDNAQAWAEDDEDRPTHLSVAVTDFYKIDGMNKAEATAEIVADLRRFFEFRNQDIDYTRTYLQMNNDEPLFINEVGSEPWRPGTRTGIPQLFLAGDFCDNDIGVVTVEGAVVSGLLAARAVQAQLRVDQAGSISALDQRLEEIPILLPKTEPGINAEALKALLLPQAAMAYAASKQSEWSRYPERALTPRDQQFHLEQALRAASALPAAGVGLFTQAAQWLADQHARGRA